MNDEQKIQRQSRDNSALIAAAAGGAGLATVGTTTPVLAQTANPVQNINSMVTSLAGITTGVVGTAIACLTLYYAFKILRKAMSF
jgi:hypothetical protein